MKNEAFFFFLRLTILGLPLCCPGLEPVLFQTQLVEKCFALKERKCVDFETRSYCLRTSCISVEQRNNVLRRKCDYNNPDTRNVNWESQLMLYKIFYFLALFTYLSLRGIFHSTEKRRRRNKSLKCTTV